MHLEHSIKQTVPWSFRTVHLLPMHARTFYNVRLRGRGGNRRPLGADGAGGSRESCLPARGSGVHLPSPVAKEMVGAGGWNRLTICIRAATPEDFGSQLRQP